MSVIGEFTVPSESFLLGETLAAVPEMVVELQRVVAHSDEAVVPFFWVHYGDKEEFDAVIRNDPTLENVVLLDEFERGTSYRGLWKKHAKGVAYAYVEAGGTILEATGQDDTWTLRIRFDDEAAVTDFHQYCRQEGIPFTLDQLYRPTQPMGGGQYGLSPAQRELLVGAYQEGYYGVPRSLSMTALADEMGTTQQNLSKRFRRAYAALIENTLVVSDETAAATGDEQLKES